MNISPLEFTPQTMTDFCGPARRVAELLDKKRQAHLARGGLPHLILLKGPPGTGKSELARWLTRQLSGGVIWNTHEFNGAAVNVEAIDRLTDFIQHTTLALDPTAYRTILIDEADAIPPAAQTKILTLLDRIRRTPRVAVVATSNYDFDKFPERLQTRFQPFDIHGPSFPELKQFLLEKFPGAPAIDQVARFACGLDPAGPLPPPEELATHTGNVRQALLDLDTALLAAA